MFCNNCGAQNPEGAKFCSNCGAQLKISQSEFKNAQGDPFVQDKQCKPVCEQSPACSQLGWHKFLIYFLLIVEAIFYLFTAYSYISGAGFGADKEYIYMNFPDVVKTVKINGYLYLALGLYTFSTRSSLAKFKSGAPGKLTLMYVFSALLALAGNAMISPAFGSVNEAPGLIITPILHALFWICINRAYYKKREELFIN